MRRIAGGSDGALQHRTRHVIGAIGRAALAAHLIGFEINILERIEGNIDRHVDGFGDRTVDMFLRRRLHRQMIVRGKRLRIDEIIRQCGFLAEARAERAIGIIADIFLAARAIGVQNLARIMIGEHRLDAARHIVREQRDRAGRRDGGEQRVADAMRGDGIANVLRQLRDEGPREIFVARRTAGTRLFPSRFRRMPHRPHGSVSTASARSARHFPASHSACGRRSAHRQGR